MTIPEAFALGLQHHQSGRLAEAEAIYRQILAVAPRHADALHMLGLAAHQSGRGELAAEMISDAIRAFPSQSEFHYNLGVVLSETGRLAGAADACGAALRMNPNDARAFHNLGNALMDLGRTDEAIAAYHSALRLAPNEAIPHNSLGLALFEKGMPDEAVAEYQRALRLDPDYVEAHNNLGNALREYGRLDEAVAAYRDALRLNPAYAEAHSNLGTVLAAHGQIEDAIACLQRAAVLAPHSASIHSNLLIEIQYSAKVTLCGLFEAHREYDGRHAAPLRSGWQAHRNDRDPERRLRLGMISPHFASHPVGHFLIRLLDNLDRSRFEVIGYSDTKREDAMSVRLRRAMAGWRDGSGISDEKLAGCVREDGIDILFDLAGHTAGNRLLAFARKPAPIQITWLDYVGTTGLSAMDYIIGDLREIPPGAERWYAEKVLRMPDDYICYDPPADAPPVGPLPALANGCVTFASFNIPPKTTPEIVRVWCRILAGVPGARLIIMNRGFDNPATRSRYEGILAAEGIGGGRVEFRGWSPANEVLACYNEVDIALDTFPYNGGLTTCEAMWMGVPVVTCPGETFASRHGLAHLSAAGMPDTVARDLDHYADLAVNLAADLRRLADLRAEMRALVARSPLCDGAAFAGHFMGLLRDVWRQWAAL